MAQNYIYYGPPGTGKTYLLQSIMNDYIDYTITDEKLRNAYIASSYNWIIITLILLQNHGRMTTSNIQNVVDRLNLGVNINVAAELELHSISDPPIMEVNRELPRVFFNTNPGEWYVDFVRVQNAKPDFYTSFLSDCPITKRYNFVTFHQSYTYENFIEGIRPEYVPSINGIDYSPKAGVFKELCELAKQSPEKEFAIFIDEINRGNISEIFGELISLIEIDKRDGEPGALSVILPYSKQTFSVPSNINIFGTMNTADRSIDQIDIALRRRFKFIPLLPDDNAIETELRLVGGDAHDIDGIDLIKLFNALNSRIELLLDSQHLLGHALFIKCRTAEDISNVIINSVVPLLEEYFFDDRQKIQLVFNDLDDTGKLRSTAIYRSVTLLIEDNFAYTADYVIDDKKRFIVTKNISDQSLKQIYQ